MTKKSSSGAVSSVANDDASQVQHWVGRKAVLVFCTILFLLCLVAHAASVWNGFTLGDYFQLQPLRGIEPKKWTEYWIQLFAEGFLHPFSAPITEASIALDFQSTGFNPALYHAVNVLLHVACVISSFLLLGRLTTYFQAGRKYLAASHYPLLAPFIACALLAVHPVASDSVAHIMSRGSLITFLCFALALNAFLTGFMANSVGRGVFGYLAAYLCVAVSIFSSCQAITIPVSMIVLGLLLKPANDGKEGSYSWQDWLYERAWEFGTLIATAVGLPFLFLLKSTLPAGNGMGLPLLPEHVYFSTQFKALFSYYLRIFFVPFGLTIAPIFAIASGYSDPGALAGMAIVAAILAMMVKFRSKPMRFFGLYLFLIGLVPQALVWQPEYASAERFYMSCFGLALVVADFLAPLLAGMLQRGGTKLLGITAKPLLVVSLALLTLVGLANWRDRAYSTNSALLRGALRLEPTDSKLRALLAFLLTIDGGVNIERGNIEALRALKQDEKLPLALMAQASSQSSQRMYSEAANLYSAALKLAEEQKLSSEIILSAKAGLALAMAEQETISNPAYMRELAKSALTLYPAKARLYLALGKAMLAEDKPESAELACRQFDRGRIFDRNDIDFTEPYVRAALNTGYPFRFEVAHGAARTAYKIKNTATAELLWARACLETGRIRKGIALMNQYFARSPQPSAEAYMVTYGLAKQLGDKAAAERYLIMAKKIDPAIEKHVHLFLIVPPKPTGEDNQGPSKIEK
ncbi:hypothetical protein KBI23_09155 [bacterium]|nr:hypothetical protein [bacterium]MBP9809284.1 hypothetical protein [bacterium]